MKLEDLKAYQVAMEIGDSIYGIVYKWDYFNKKTLGAQLVRSADSMAANLGEGYGRYFYKETKVFLYYARGSAHETKIWIRKAKSRQLVDQKEYDQLLVRCERMIALLNGLIKATGRCSD